MNRPQTLLIVDDEPMIVKALTRLLRAPGRRVIGVTDPVVALAVVDEEPVDVIISDKDMPQLSGITLLASVRLNHPDIVRVLLTGRATLDSALSAINRGEVFRYLTKPWDDEALEATIAEALAHRADLLRAEVVRNAAGRRQRLLAALSQANPGLLEVGEGPHVLAIGPVADHLDGLLRRLQGEGADAGDLRPAVKGACAQASAVELVDALLAIPLRHATVSVAVEPWGDAHQISVEIGPAATPLIAIPRPLGDAVAARLALLAGLDPSAPAQAMGRLSLAGGGATAALAVVYQVSGAGPTVELRRLVHGTDATPTRPREDFIGRYRVLEKLGEGATGTVYRAVHTALEKPVAIKVLRAASGRDPVAVARFVREARAGSRPAHPGIVEVQDYGELPDGRPFLVMELVEMPTLELRMEQSVAAPIDAVKIARGIAEGLGAAHAAQLIHRDLKPANVFVGPDLAVKITDFGSAKMVHMVGPALTQDGCTIGTPFYMSPEHASSETVDHRTDIYALGCVLFEMLCGAPPYRGDTTRDILLKHISADIPKPTSPWGALPPELIKLIQKAMAKRPDDRHQDTAELIADLDVAAAALSRPSRKRWVPWPG